METDGSYSILEGELRQSLLRGYSRLRRAQVQGRRLEEAERVLELLGDPQVLAIKHPKYDWTVRMPLVFVASWDLNRGERVRERVIGRLPKSGLTLYKRRHGDQESDRSGIHDKIVHALESYTLNCEITGGMLLDILWAPRPEEHDHTESTTANWTAFYPANGSPHWLFPTLSKEDLPDHVWDVNSLVRLTFPLVRECKVYPFKMITLLLGLSFKQSEPAIVPDGERDGQVQKPTGSLLSPEREAVTPLVKGRIRWTRRIARIIMDDIPYLNEKITERQSMPQKLPAPPEWLNEIHRDALHTAVDDLHRRVADLANRSESASWYEKKAGFNFLIAFKELDDSYRACLRYRLSVFNLCALGDQHADVKSWARQLEEGVRRNEDQLSAVLARSDQGKEDAERYLRECYEAIDATFLDIRNLDAAKCRMREMIESTPYPMRLTPGYHVMNLSHPEFIRDWLRDPRAKNFEKYPVQLLAWETTVLPPRIYYSQIADGSLPVGVCGVNAELLERWPAYYELQEIIDESGPRFRHILCEEEFAILHKDLRDALGRTSSEKIWDSLLVRFRRVAYYFLASPLDYRTKLVRDSDIQGFDGRWSPEGNGRWSSLSTFKTGDVRTLMDAVHLAEAWHKEAGLTGRNQEYVGRDGRSEEYIEEDFIKNYLSGCIREGMTWQAALLGARLHRIKLEGVEDTSLLVLIPDPQNSDLARDLIRQFVRRCELAAEDYKQAVVRRSVGSGPDPRGSARPASYDVFLSYNTEDKEGVEALALRLKAEGITPWFDRSELEPGEKWADVLQEQIRTIRSAAVLMGRSELGPWQELETGEILSGFVDDRRQKIFPVVLPGGRRPQKIPPFFNQFQWVDFNQETDAFEKLVEAIKGLRAT